MGSVGTSVSRLKNVSVTDYSSMSDAELTAAYDDAVARRDRDAVMRIVDETTRREAEKPVERTPITYRSKDIRRRGARGRK